MAENIDSADFIGPFTLYNFEINITQNSVPTYIYFFFFKMPHVYPQLYPQ